MTKKYMLDSLGSARNVSHRPAGDRSLGTASNGRSVTGRQDAMRVNTWSCSWFCLLLELPRLVRADAGKSPRALRTQWYVPAQRLICVCLRPALLCIGHAAQRPLAPTHAVQYASRCSATSIAVSVRTHSVGSCCVAETSHWRR